MNKNVFGELSKYLDDRDILNTLMTHKGFYDEKFFQSIMQAKYPLLTEFKKPDETWQRFYLRMTHAIAKIKELFNVPYIPVKGYNPSQLYEKNKRYLGHLRPEIMGWVGKWGNINLINSLFNSLSHADIVYIMQGAAKAGHIHIVKSFIYNISTSNYNLIVSSATAGGHMDIVQFMIDKMIEKGIQPNYNFGMLAAAERGQIDIVKYMIQSGATNLTSGITVAARNGHINIVKFILEQGARDVDEAFLSAASRGHTNIIEFLFDKISNERRQYLIDTALEVASANGHLDTIKFIINNLSPQDLIAKSAVEGIKFGIKESIDVAARKGYMDIVKYLVETSLIIYNEIPFLGIAIRESKNKGHLDIDKYLESL